MNKVIVRYHPKHHTILVTKLPAIAFFNDSASSDYICKTIFIKKELIEKINNLSYNYRTKSVLLFSMENIVDVTPELIDKLIASRIDMQKVIYEIN